MSSAYELDGTHRRRTDALPLTPIEGADVRVWCVLRVNPELDQDSMNAAVRRLLYQGPITRPEKTALHVIEAAFDGTVWRFRFSFYYAAWRREIRWTPFGGMEREKALHRELHAAMSALNQALMRELNVTDQRYELTVAP